MTSSRKSPINKSYLHYLNQDSNESIKAMYGCAVKKAAISLLAFHFGMSWTVLLGHFTVPRVKSSPYCPFNQRNVLFSCLSPQMSFTFTLQLRLKGLCHEAVYGQSSAEVITQCLKPYKKCSVKGIYEEGIKQISFWSTNYICSW